MFLLGQEVNDQLEQRGAAPWREPVEVTAVGEESADDLTGR